MRIRRRRRVGAIVLVLAALATRHARAQPRNDACVDRTYVTFLPYSDRETVTAATLAAGEPGPTCAPEPVDHSVWYALPPPIDGLYLFSTCGSDFDTALQLYDGAFCDQLHAHACNDDSDICGRDSKQSAVLLRLPRGPASIVHAQVTSVGPTAGVLRFAMQLVPRARNDECAAARVLTRGVFAEVLDVAHTGADAADPQTLDLCGAVGNVALGDAPHSIWYRYTASQTGPVAIDPTGTNTPVAIAVFLETAAGCAALGDRIACAANMPLTFPADAGQTYRVYVAVPARVQPDEVTIRFTGPNGPPVAVATAPASAGPGATVVLDGSGSHDPDADPLTYRWTQSAGPAVQLDDPAAATTQLVVPEVAADTSLGFTLTVSDGESVAQAAVTIAVVLAEADHDGDGVPATRDRCPDTAPGRIVDADGCACDDPGHVTCKSADSCTVGRCEQSTARCIAVRLPVGSACADDGDGCTLDHCDATGQCTHERVGSYAGAACDLGDLVARIGSADLGDSGPSLAQLVDRARIRVGTAEASAVVGDRRRASGRLRRATRLLLRFAHRVARLETRRRIPSAAAGQLLDRASVTAQRIAALDDLGAGAAATLPASR